MVKRQPVVLVTGASSGIGSAAAAAFAAKGYEVFGTGRNIGRIQPTAGVEFVQLDVTDDDSVAKAVQTVIDRAGRIDVLVNNAGALLLGGAEETSAAQAQDLFDTNFFGVVRMTNAVLPHMRAQGGGRIVNVGSVVGFVPTPYSVFYSSSKYALEGYSQGLDHELREFGIRVTLVEPGYTNTAIDSAVWMGDTPIPAYAARRAQAHQEMTESIASADSPETVAAVIVRAASASSPKLRYPAGGFARVMTRVVRYAPASLLDSAIRRATKLNKAAVTPGTTTANTAR
ncbi:oxidoreductase [Mycobacterium sp. URHB0044]|uniref:oxidoreductase n=1 Tax=Mycobacterium sp. URHB0044 TaxID=1380386 RepID=UPI000687F260|nr:oxidoreductase [Mycobacterium sp. URHB0044]